ncbi:MAG: hypothetical protein ACJ79S_10500 [Gemmatimonadaceae bacterium]
MQHWKEAHEAAPPGVTVYRPAAALADVPARGRRGMILRPDGEYVEEGIASTDGVLRSKGHWEMIAPDLLVVTQGGARKTLRILEHDADVLRVTSAD